MKQKNVLVLSLFTVAALGVAAIALRSQTAEVSRTERPRLFPELYEHINDVAAVHLEKAGKSATLEREGGQWKLTDRGGYPALFEKVKELAVRVATLEIEETKTAKKENHARLAVEWPASAADDADEGEPGLVTLKDASGKELAALVVGKSDWGRGNSPKVYVRRAGDDQVYLCSSPQSLEVDPATRRWIEAKVLELSSDRVQDVSIEHADGERVEIGRSAANHTQFVVQNLPLGQSERFEGIANGVAQALSSLTLEDVRPASEIDFSTEPLAKARFRCVDGLEVLVETARAEDKTWLKISTSYTAPPESSTPPSEGGEDAEKAGEGAEAMPEGEAGIEEKKDVGKEALELSQRLSPWAFDVGSYKAELLARRMKDLLPEPSDAAMGDGGLDELMEGFDHDHPEGVGAEPSSPGPVAPNDGNGTEGAHQEETPKAD